MIILNFSLFIIILLSNLISASAAMEKEKAQDEILQETQDAGQRTLQRLMSDYYSEVFNIEPELYKERAVKVAAYADFNVLSDAKNKKILFPLAFVFEIMLQAKALMQVYDEKLDMTLYQNYLQYLESRTKKSLEMKKEIPIEEFWFWAKLTPPCCKNKEDEVNYQNTLDKIMLDVMAFPLAHEIGHIVLGHRRYNEKTAEESRKDEYDADEYAINLVEKYNHNVDIAIITVFFRFDWAERLQRNGVNKQNTHPSAPCRIEHVMRGVLKRISNDAAEKELFESRSAMSVSQLQSYFREIKIHCDVDDLYIPE